MWHIQSKIIMEAESLPKNVRLFMTPLMEESPLGTYLSFQSKKALHQVDNL
jgi:hypothetical protein